MKGSRKKVFVDAVNPDQRVIEEAAEIIRAGGLVVFPTRFLYGLGADALNPEAVDRVFSVKKRAPEKPVSVLVADREDMNGLVADLPPAGRLLSDRLWPGGITLVFRVSPDLPGNLTSHTGKIGIRLPGHPFAAALLKKTDGPVTATSANLSGTPGCSRIDELPDSIINEVDMVIDVGPLPGGTGSTVIDVTIDPPEILREGTVAARRISAILKEQGVG